MHLTTIPGANLGSVATGICIRGTTLVTLSGHSSWRSPTISLGWSHVQLLGLDLSGPYSLISSNHNIIWVWGLGIASSLCPVENS